MSDKPRIVEMDFATLMAWVKRGQESHGIDWAADWLLEEFRRQPVSFTKMLLSEAGLPVQ